MSKLNVSTRGTDTDGAIAMLEASMLRAHKLADAVPDEADWERLAEDAEAQLERLRADMDPKGFHVFQDIKHPIPGRAPGEQRYMFVFKVTGETRGQYGSIECTPKVFERYTGHLISQFVNGSLEAAETDGDSHRKAIARTLNRRFKSARMSESEGFLRIEVPLAQAGELRRIIAA